LRGSNETNLPLAQDSTSILKNQQPRALIYPNAESVGVHLSCLGKPNHAITLTEMLVNDCIAKEIESRGDGWLPEAIGNHDASHHRSTSGSSGNDSITTEQMLQLGFYFRSDIAIS
jgi:hypothetical protein